MVNCIEILEVTFQLELHNDKGGAMKLDEFSEKFQMAFDPPLIFVKSYCK